MTRACSSVVFRDLRAATGLFATPKAFQRPDSTIPPKTKKAFRVMERLCGVRVLHRSIEHRPGHGERRAGRFAPAAESIIRHVWDRAHRFLVGPPGFEPGTCRL